MKFNNLNSEVREAMLAELSQDIKNNKLKISSYLIESEQHQWVDLLKQAIIAHDEQWLAQELKKRSLIRRRQLKSLKSGKFTLALIPENAEELIAQDDFNFYYMRGLCRYGIRHNQRIVEVCHAKRVSKHRDSSKELVGHKLRAEDVLNDLTSYPRGHGHLGLALPNSSLTLKIT